MNPRIERFPGVKLIGQRLEMCFVQDRTVDLWRSFTPRIREIRNRSGSHMYAVDIYPTADFFAEFDPMRIFDKWAAVEVDSFRDLPRGMENLTIPAGTYAVFHYKGRPSEAQAAFQYIYGEWLPNSEYKMDSRPYFAIMGQNYKGEDPDSEEEFWIPVKERVWDL